MQILQGPLVQRTQEGPMLGVPGVPQGRRAALRHYEAADLRILAARRNRILARMSIIATANASRLQHRPEKVHVRSASSNPPPGTRTQHDMSEPDDGPPSKDRCLFDYYRYLFEHAGGDVFAVEKLCARAEKDYAAHVKGNGRPHNEDGPARDRRILRDYRGVPPWEVATWEDCDPESVRRLRRLSELDPQSGHPDVNLSDRDRTIVRMTRDGATTRAIAAVVEVSHVTVQKVANAA